MVEGGANDDVGGRRRALVEELRAVEQRSLRLRAGLAALGPGTALPGVHLLADVAGARVLLPGARVAEVARVVACEPVPGASPAVAGGFVWRGRPALAVDLGERLGGAPSFDSLDALMVILDGEPSVALVVDGVRALVEDPEVAGGGAALDAPGLVLGACRVGDETVAVLAPEAIEREVQGSP